MSDGSGKRIELELRPGKPIAREVVLREVAARLAEPDSESGLAEGVVGRSARCRATIRSAGEHVQRLDLLFEVEEAEDVEALVDLCYDLAESLRAGVFDREGGGLDPARVAAMVREGLGRARRGRVLHIGLSMCAVAIGCLALYGVELTSPIGFRVTRFHFVGFGVMALLVGGGLLLAELRATTKRMT